MGLFSWNDYAWLSLLRDQKRHHEIMDTYKRTEDIYSANAPHGLEFGSVPMTIEQEESWNTRQKNLKDKRNVMNGPTNPFIFDYPSYWEFLWIIGLSLIYFGHSYFWTGVIFLGIGVIYLIPRMRYVSKILIVIGIILLVLNKVIR